MRRVPRDNPRRAESPPVPARPRRSAPAAPAGRRVWLASLAAAILAVTLIAAGGCARDSRGTLERVRATGVLPAGTDATYPPFDFVDATSGEVTGFDIELMRAVAGELGVRVEFIVVPFDGIIAGLKGGKYDVVASAMTITPERAREVAFSDPYVVAGQSVVVRRGGSDGPDGPGGPGDPGDPDGPGGPRGPGDPNGSEEPESPAALLDRPGLRIGCQLGTTGEIEARKVPGARVVSFDAIGSAFRDLENGNLDAVIADTPTARIFIRDHGTLALAGEPLTREEFGLAMRPADQDLRRAVNEALQALRASGELSRIEERWGIAPER